MKFHRKNGFTLVEMIIALAIFAIIFVAFLSMFSMAIMSVYRAGNKSEAVSKAQSSVESDIASSYVESAQEFVLNFGMSDLAISGGIVKANSVEGNSVSEIQTFLPFVPAINIAPSSYAEGSVLPRVITVEGFNTNFKSGSTTAALYDSLDQLVYTLQSPTVTDLNNATFVVNKMILNKQGSLYLKVVTILDVATGKTETATARFYVEMPELIATGEQVVVSGNGSSWALRSDSALDATFPSFSNIKAIKQGGFRVVAAGDSGKVITGGHFLNYNSTSVASNNFVSVGWDNTADVFYVASTEGRVYSSSVFPNWTQELNTGVELFSVDAYGGYVLTSGANGFIAEKVGASWNDYSAKYGGLDIKQSLINKDPYSRFTLFLDENGSVYRNSIPYDASLAETIELSNVKSLHEGLSSVLAVTQTDEVYQCLDGTNTWNLVTDVDAANFVSSDIVDLFAHSTGIYLLADDDRIIKVEYGLPDLVITLDTNYDLKLLTGK